MAKLDATQIAQLAVRVGLLDEEQIQDSWDDVAQDPENGALLLHSLERKGLLTPWQSQKLLKGETDGYFLGGYKLLYLISAGSFGRVYRAEDPHSGFVVAIKVLRKRWTDDPKSTELFHREGKVGQALIHTNIVQILAVERDPATGQHFMVMEFVEGGTLKDFLAVRKKLEPAEALQLIEDAAAGLAYAYQCGMTHRDIKPTNILISAQGTAKLVDFGLAGLKATQQAEWDAREGKRVSAGVRAHVEATEPDEVETKVQRTVDYAGLENATGVPAGDVRSDIFFLGCVLYEMLTGRPPLETSKVAQERMSKWRFDRVAPMRPEEVQGPPSLFHLVATMMALNPHHRYQTPRQAVEAIQQVRAELAGDRVAAEPASTVRTVFVIEASEKLRETIRNRFKELGYKVLVSADPARAVDRFEQQPFHALVVDAVTTGEEGFQAFQQVMGDSALRQIPMAGILLLSEDQRSWGQRLYPRPQQEILVRPITIKQLETKLIALLPLAKVVK